MTAIYSLTHSSRFIVRASCISAGTGAHDVLSMDLHPKAALCIAEHFTQPEEQLVYPGRLSRGSMHFLCRGLAVVLVRLPRPHDR